MWHIVLLPLVIGGLTVWHVLLVRRRGVVPPFAPEPVSVLARPQAGPAGEVT
jgi:ubiquinol-cytochrome c reductase cytochrome b subunit